MTKLIALKEVKDRVGFSHTWIYQRLAEGQFPQPIKFGSATRWNANDIDEWINRHVEASKGGEVAV